MNKNNPEKSLSQALSSWRVAPSRDPRFRQEVWDRIGRRKRESAWPGYLQAHLATAASLAVIAAATGALTGYAQGREQAQEHREAMAAAYVKSIDPASDLLHPR